VGQDLGSKARTSLPEGVHENARRKRPAMQYGACLATLIAHLMLHQTLPDARLARLMTDLFGVGLRATIPGPAAEEPGPPRKISAAVSLCAGL